MNNMDYFEHAKQTMLNNLNLAQKYVKGLRLNNISQEFETIYQTLQREYFEVMVVGEFSNGKSTFINALMRNTVLPSSNVPTTAYINKITYAETPKFEVHYANEKKDKLDREQFLAFVSEDKRKFDQVKDALTKKLNPLAKKATHLQIGYPADICKNNIVIIDSPGTNDMNEHRVKITDEYIPKSDAAIFVLNAKKIFSASERAFLQRIMDADIKKIFFVINFKDAINTEEQFQEIEKLVIENLPPDLLQPKVHFVSALHALQHYVQPAVSNNNNPRARRKQAAHLPLEQTGMPELEKALFTFLQKDSGKTKLSKPLHRAEKLLREVIDQDLNFEIQSLSQSIENIEQQVEEFLQKLQVVKKNMKSDVQKFSREVERESKEIINWYKIQITEINLTVKNSLRKGLAAGEMPEDIKTNIDLITAPLEKKLKQQLIQKTESMTLKLFSNHLAQLKDDISTLSKSLFNQDNSMPDWGEIIIATSSDESNNDAAVGGAILGGALLFFTGGTLGWGLLGAGAGAVTVGAVAANKKANPIEELNKQVRDRYENRFTNQIKELERSFKRLENELLVKFEDYTSNMIEAERKRTEKLLENQQMSSNEQQQKIKELKTQQKNGENLIRQFNKTFNDYCRNEGVGLDV